MEQQHFDVIIVGGGLAGLSQAILLRKAGHQVAVVEKNHYPFHRVCGEYISNESRPFLLRLGLPLHDWQLPEISRLQISAPQGFVASSSLRLGGFGVSRYQLDHHLCLLAESMGVVVRQNTKATGYTFENECFTVETTAGQLQGCLVLGSFGKYEPAFLESKPDGLTSPFIGVKYHIRLNHDPGLIALHNFKNGYCGISKVENDLSCLCYLTHAQNLKDSGNQIRLMEEKILFQNPHLRQIFEKAQFIFDKPLTISGIGFHPRTRQKREMLLLGDAAGTIAPLAGNGMSMALHASSLLAPLVDRFLRGLISRQELVEGYDRIWKSNFSRRILWGYRLQHLFGNPWLTYGSLRVVAAIPPVFRQLIRLTHGQPF